MQRCCRQLAGKHLAAAARQHRSACSPGTPPGRPCHRSFQLPCRNCKAQARSGSEGCVCSGRRRGPVLRACTAGTRPCSPCRCCCCCRPPIERQRCCGTCAQSAHSVTLLLLLLDPGALTLLLLYPGTPTLLLLLLYPGTPTLLLLQLLCPGSTHPAAAAPRLRGMLLSILARVRVQVDPTRQRWARPSC